jgi:hypothetical protein
MEITFEITKWGLGLYAPWFGLDLTYGFMATTAVLVVAVKFLHKRGIYFSRFGKGSK